MRFKFASHYWFLLFLPNFFVEGLPGISRTIIQDVREVVSLMEENDTSSATCGEFAGSISITLPTTMAADKTNYNIAKKQYSAIQMMLDYINQERCGVELEDGKYSLRLTSLSDAAEKEQVSLITDIKSNTTDVFLGPYSSGLTGALTSVSQEKGILAMTAGAASTSVFANKTLAYGTLPPATNYLDHAVAGLAEVGAKKIASFYSDASFTTSACSRVSDLASEHEMEVTSSKMVESPPSIEELNELVTKYRDNEDPDVVVACVYNEGCEGWLTAMRQANWSPKAQVFTVCVGDEVLQDKFGKDLYGIIGVTPWDRSETAMDTYTNWSASEFATKFEAFSFVDATYHAASAAASIVILADAIERTTNIDAESIATTLNTIEFQTFFGNVSFDDMGQNTKKNLAIQYNKDLEIETIFPTKSSSASPIYPLPNFALRDCMFSDCKECNSDGTCKKDKNVAAIASVSAIAGVLLLVLLFLSYRMYKLSKYTKTLEERGEAVPRMSLGRRMSSARMSLDQVVEKAKEESTTAKNAAKVAAEDEEEEEEVVAEDSKV